MKNILFQGDRHFHLFFGATVQEKAWKLARTSIYQGRWAAAILTRWQGGGKSIRKKTLCN
jgi:hypothetical protein